MAESRNDVDAPDSASSEKTSPLRRACSDDTFAASHDAVESAFPLSFVYGGVYLESVLQNL